MLLQHFKLGMQPFGVTPDARFLYLSATHREAIASLLYGMHSGRGFTALVAPPGMGKTTLLFHVLGLVAENAKTAFLFQTLCEPEQFLRSLLADLGFEDQGSDISCMHAKLNDYLLQQSKIGRQVIVVVDEAQNLDERVLELIRMLSNFETPSKKLIHLILSGQPQLAKKLASDSLTQLRQRISIVAKLAPLNAEETRKYIDHRLRIAGAAPDVSIFSNQAYSMIAGRSGGIPRNINNLCFNSMSIACALKQPQVDASMVQETMDDLDLTVAASTQVASIHNDIASRLPEALTPRPLPSLSAAWWRYAAAAGVGFLFSLLLLTHFGALPKSRVLPQQTESFALQDGKLDPPTGPASDVSAPSEGNTKQALESEMGAAQAQALNGVAHGTSSIRVPYHRPRSASSHRPVATAGLSKPAIDLDAATADLPLGPLPKDMQRRILVLSVGRQQSENSQTAPEQNQVPFEPVQQGEKP